MFELSSMIRKLVYQLKKTNASPGETFEPLDASDRRKKPIVQHAKYQIGEVVHHRLFDFRGVIFDVDPEFANSEDWYQAIPEDIRPHRAQPYYHLFAENDKSHYTAYVSEQNLVLDKGKTPVSNPDIEAVFILTDAGKYQLRSGLAN